MKPLILLEFVLYFSIQLYVLMTKGPMGTVPLDVWIIMAMCASTAFAVAIMSLTHVFRMIFRPAKKDQGFALIFSFTTIMAAVGAYAATIGLGLYYEPESVLWFLGVFITMMMYMLLPGIAIIQIVIHKAQARREALKKEFQENSLFSPRG